MSIGYHITKKSIVLDETKTHRTLIGSIQRHYEKIPFKSFQIFTHVPRSGRKMKLDYDAINSFVEETRTEIVVHTAYPSVGIWKIFEYKDLKKQLKEKDITKKKKKLLEKKIKEEKRKNRNRIKLILEQLETCDELNCKYLVLHLPKKEHKLVAKCMKFLKPELKKYKCKICLEIEVFKPDKNTHETPEKLNKLVELLNKSVSSKYWTLCLDTAHLWGAGVDIRSYTKAQEYLEALSPLVRKRVKVIHLNGSEVERATNLDRHAIAFSPYDKIWGDVDVNQSGIRPFWKFAKKNKLPIIYEIKRGEEKYTKKLMKMKMV